MIFWSIILFTGIVTGVVILFLLFRMNKVLKRYTPLIVYVFLILIMLVERSLVEINLEAFPHILYISEPFAMLFGLLIYLYARNQSNPKLQLRKSDWLLVIPFVLAVISYLPYYMLSAKEKLADHAKFGTVKQDVLENVWEWNFEIVLSAAFLIAALRELEKYRVNIKEQFSDVHKVDLHLTRLIIKVSLAGYLFEFVFVFLTLFGFPYYSILFELGAILNFAVIFFIGYDALISYRHIHELQEGWAEIPIAEVKLDGQIVKYAKSALTEQSIQEIRQKLLNYMDEHQPFLQPKLRIKDLSELTGISSHHISQVINESFRQNFYEFVNGYRVEAAKKLLKNPDFKNYTYTAIGFEVGFNSKSAFYTAFKKKTGSTPAQY